MRICSSCKQELENSSFYASKDGKDGLTRQCKSCLSVSSRAYRERTAEARKASNKAYREANREKLKAKDREYYAANKEHMNATNRDWYQRNKERAKAYIKQWQAENPEKVKAAKAKNKQTRKDTIKAEYERNKADYYARAAERRATKKSRTPEWADMELVNEYYRAVQTLNKYFGANAFHVDHIVPLKSDLVSGLHTDANLQMLTGKANLSKRNTYWPNMP